MSFQTQNTIPLASKFLKTAQNTHAENFTSILCVQKQETHASSVEAHQVGQTNLSTTFHMHLAIPETQRHKRSASNLAKTNQTPHATDIR